MMTSLFFDGCINSKNVLNVDPRFVETEISLDNETCETFGSLLIPIKKPVLVALIISGSGLTDRNGNNPQMQNNSLKMLAEELAENNIASLRYDKRGIGESIIADFDESKLRLKIMLKMLQIGYLF